MTLLDLRLVILLLQIKPTNLNQPQGLEHPVNQYLERTLEAVRDATRRKQLEGQKVLIAKFFFVCELLGYLSRFFLLTSRSSTKPCRSQILLYVKRTCSDCKRPGYHKPATNKKPKPKTTKPKNQNPAKWYPGN